MKPEINFRLDLLGNPEVSIYNFKFLLKQKY